MIRKNWIKTMSKTIKQVADELGVSKDKIKYQVGKLPSNYLDKLPSGIITINADGIRVISEHLGKITHLLPRKNIHFITHLEKQVEQQQKQIEHLQQLLENQQVLTLQSQEKVKLLESEKEYIDEEKKKRKWKFWR